MTWFQWVFLIIRLVLSVPNLVIGWLFVLLFSWAAHKHRIDYPLILTAELKDWAAKKWPFSTTVAYGVLIHPHSRRKELSDPRTRTEEHEMEVHVSQFEDVALLGMILGLIIAGVTGNWWWFLALWGLSPALIIPNFIGALLRHGRPCPEGRGWFTHWVMQTMYRDCEHERSAYAQTSGHPESWLTWRRRVRDED